MRRLLDQWRVVVWWLIGRDATANRKDRRGAWFGGLR